MTIFLFLIDMRFLSKSECVLFDNGVANLCQVTVNSN